MTPEEYRAERHREMWTTWNRRVSRVVIGTLVLGFLLQLKVLQPYVGRLEELVRLADEQELLRGQLADLQSGLDSTRHERTEIDALRSAVELAPWRTSKDDLIAELRQVRQDGLELLQAEPGAVRGALDPSAFALPTEADMVLQRVPSEQPMESPLVTPARARILRKLSPEDLRQLRSAPSDMIALLRREHPRDRLTDAMRKNIAERMNTTPGVVDVVVSADPDQVNELRDLADEELWPEKYAVDKDLRKASETLKLTVSDIDNLGADSWRALVYGKATAVFRSATRSMVTTVSSDLEKSIVSPLRAIIESHGPALSGDYAKALEHAQKDLMDWTDKHIHDTTWAKTIDGKNEAFSALDRLFGKLDQTVESVENDLLELDEDLAATQERLEQELQDAKNKETGVDESIVHIDERMRTLLPSWLSDLITLDEFVQVFPVAGFAIGLWGFYAVRRVRGHYLVVRKFQRSEGIDITDPSLSSLWTLVYRGRGATMATLFAYIAAIGAAGYLFYHGCSDLSRWHGVSDVASSPLAVGILPWVRWLGILLLVAMPFVVLIILWKDQRLVRAQKRS